MENIEIINFRAVSKKLGYSPTHVRKNKRPKNEDHIKAIEKLVKFVDNWAEKYTKTK